MTNDPTPVLSLEYESTDVNRAAARRRFNSGLLLIAIPCLLSPVVHVFWFAFWRLMSATFSSDAYLAADLSSQVGIVVGAWIVFGFRSPDLRRIGPFGWFGRGLITLVFLEHLAETLSYRLWVFNRVFGIFSVAKWEVVESLWLLVTTGALIHTWACVNGFHGRRHSALLLVAVLRGIVGVATSIYGYFYISQFIRTVGSIAALHQRIWEASSIASVVISGAVGLVLFLLLRDLRRPETRQSVGPA